MVPKAKFSVKETKPVVVTLEVFKRDQAKWVDISVSVPVLVLDEDGEVLIEMDMVRPNR